MNNETVELVASNLTIAFYSGAVKREPYLEEDKRKALYSPTQRDRDLPTISMKEVKHVYEYFCRAVAAQTSSD